MMDQSILRAHRDRDDSIEKERRARVAKMMNKIYEAKITTKEKPYIHTMYENYHQKFCKKFNAKYMQQARLAFQKAQQQGGLSKVFGKQSVISDHPPSASSDSSNILEGLNHEFVKKNSTSEIRPNEIKKAEYASEVKTEAKVNEMMKKKAPQDAESVSKMKEEPKKKQSAVYPKKSLIKQINEIPRVEISKQVQNVVKKQEVPKKQIAKPAIVKQISVSQIQVVKKVEQSKAQVKNVKQQPIKPNVNEEDEEQEQVEQDSGPSIYDLKMKAKLKQIDDPVKHVTTSHILPTKQDISGIHPKSYIASHQPDELNCSKDTKQNKDLQEYSKKQKVDKQEQVIDKIQVDTEQNEQKEEVVHQIQKQEVRNKTQAKNEDKVIDQPLQEQKMVDKSMKGPQYVPILQQLRQQLQDSSSQAQGEQESALTIFTDPDVDHSRQEVTQKSVDQAEPQQFSTEIKSQHQNIPDKQEEVPPQQIPKVSPQKTESEVSDRPQVEKKMESTSRSQAEATSKMKPKDILEREQPVQKIQNAEQLDQTHQLNDDIENRIDRIVSSFQDWLNNELPPCEKCPKKEEESQQQSQKNSSDDQ